MPLVLFLPVVAVAAAAALLGLGCPAFQPTQQAPSPAVQATGSPEAPMALGTNLAELVDWASDWSHLDLHKRMRIWRTRGVDSYEPYDTGYGPELVTNEEGWPTEVPFRAPDGSLHFVHTTLHTVDAPGDYVLRAKGKGELYLKYPGGRETIAAKGKDEAFRFTLASGASFSYEIRSTDPKDPLRGITITRELGKSGTFHPEFLERLSIFGLLRFMDWGRTNASPLTHWSERTRPNHYTQARAQGAALETMVALANTTRQDAWVCIPHSADDEYVKHAAELIHAQLLPGLRIWIEYSNETWNRASAFTQTRYVEERGLALGLARDRNTAAARFVALRSQQIWKVFEETIGPGSARRLVKVLASQSARPSLSRERLVALNELDSEAASPDVLAIAPYFGFSLTPDDIPPRAASYPTVDQIVGTLSRESIAGLRREVAEQKAIADEYGLALVCYEGGQHFVGKRGAENDEVLTATLHRANRDPRMHTRYSEYLALLAEEGVALFVHYTYCRTPNKRGSWGALESMDQETEDAPKHRALTDWAAKHSGRTSTREAEK